MTGDGDSGSRVRIDRVSTMLLQQPGRIGNLLLKNRVVMAPMGTNYSTTDGLSSHRDRAYYAERARGGVAICGQW